MEKIITLCVEMLDTLLSEKYNNVRNEEYLNLVSEVLNTIKTKYFCNLPNERELCKDADNRFNELLDN
ncbi:MAG: hypothetical protein ACK5M1_08665 [Xanthomarina gelatinilytica]|uniref:hypothetical protein n=1 Tax=Xanthomarina gelatinilytica TaxID=1137281 RepID=UPI003A8C3FCB